MHALSFPSLSRPRSGLLYIRSRESAPPALPALAVAVVGSRKYSHGGPVAFAFASRAAESGFAGGITVAVLPCGLDRVAPVSNTNLANSILAANGFLASEYSPGTPVRNFRFVERNKVIVSLSRAAIVMEAQLKSGTMHTAHFAHDQNKALACYMSLSRFNGQSGGLHNLKLFRATIAQI